MFKKLRNWFLILNMIFTSLVMLVAFFAVYMTTYKSMQTENQRKIEQMSEMRFLTITGSLNKHTAGERMISADYVPSFNIEMDNDGEVINIESFIDMPFETYKTVASMAWGNSNGEHTIHLDGRVWLFAAKPAEIQIINNNGVKSIITSGNYKYYFLDITDSQNTLRNLLFTFLMVGIVMLAVIFFLSLYFANRSIKPISQAWEKQRQFVADASHELKTPLSIVTANYDALLANQDETIRSQREWLDYLKIGTDRMGNLIDGLLSLARIEEAGNVHFFKTEFNLSVAIEKEIQVMKHYLWQKNITTIISIQPNIIVYSNEEEILRIFSILFDNAVKYTDENGRIEIMLSKGKKHVIGTVKNTGSGIAPQDINKVFDRFYRADCARSSQGGYGLGLPIAKTIIDRLGGRITVQSIENEDTTFTLII